MNMVDRRAVLSGIGATAAVASIGAFTGRPASTLDISPMDRDTRSWRELRRRVKGPLFRSASANYWALNMPTNPRYANIHAEGILCPDGDSDVTEAITWARKNGLPVTARGGGHSYAGFSNTEGLLMPFARMRKVRLDADEGTLTVEAGARNTDVFEVLKDTDLLLPGGRCPAVGVSGLVLGGGIGLATRAYGLTCDSLMRTSVATASGELLTCDENREADLFWACRGGAGGNFGINTSYTFRLHRVSGVTIYDLSWEWQDASRAIVAAAELIEQPETARTLSCQFGLRTRGTRVYAQGIYFGARAGLEQAIAPLLSLSPARTIIEERRIWPAISYFYQISSGDPYFTKSIVSPRALAAGTVHKLVARMDEWVQRSPESEATIAFFAMGGEDAVPAPEDTAYVHRDARFIMSMTTYWANHDPSAVQHANIAWLNTLYDDMSADLGTRAYQNFPDRELPNWWTAYYGSNYRRLVRVKEQYDPRQIFRYPQGIRPHPGRDHDGTSNRR
ncbi:FAD-binding oxidoreductase [Streptomyces sp. NPDC055709]